MMQMRRTVVVEGSVGAPEFLTIQDSVRIGVCSREHRSDNTQHLSQGL